MRGIFAPRWLIVVLPVLAALGTHALPFTVAGVNVFAFRMLIMVMVAFSTPLTSGSSWWFNKLARRAMLLGVLWVLWGMVSLLWSPNVSGGVADIMSIGFGFALLLVLFTLRAHESENLRLLRLGWVAAFLVTAAVAVWEIGTGQHLHGGLYDSRPEYFDGTVVQSTLGDPGFYGGFLLLATPFLLWSFYEAHGPKKLIYAGFLVAAGILILFSAKRSAFLGFAAEVLVLVFIFDRRWYVMVLGLVAILVGYVWWSNVFLSSDMRLADKFDKAISDKREDRSISTRVGLSLNGLWMVYDTGGRGVGAGGFTDAIIDRDVPLRLAIYKSDGFQAHNLWVQIASEYGILPVVGLVALFLFIARLALQAANRRPADTSREVQVLGSVTLVGLIGYVIFGVVVGSVLRQSVHWMFFASLLVVGAHLYEARRARSQSRGLRRPLARASATATSNLGSFGSSGRRTGKIGGKAVVLHGMEARE